jgi:hypothetical protein
LALRLRAIRDRLRVQPSTGRDGACGLSAAEMASPRAKC